MLRLGLTESGIIAEAIPPKAPGDETKPSSYFVGDGFEATALYNESGSFTIWSEDDACFDVKAPVGYALSLNGSLSSDRLCLNKGFNSVDVILTPSESSIVSVSPNPFNSICQISFTLKEAGNTSIDLLDLTGRSIRKLHEGSLTSGNHSVTASFDELPSGVYLIRVFTEDGKTHLTRVMLSR